MIRLAASPREAAPPRVCALRTDLLARLSLAAAASTQAQTRLQLRALGVRRTGTVTANLVRELSMAHRMAASAGVWVQPLELQRRVGVLARPGALACHLSGLATAYRHITLDPALPPDGPLAKWLAGRQRVHLVQLESIEKLADRNPRPSACSGRYALAASRSKTVIGDADPLSDRCLGSFSVAGRPWGDIGCADLVAAKRPLGLARRRAARLD